ncbi:hypothetical protein EXIGLDRAFT_498086 [Exidia glandulosa HHB12029]|uniref:Uncharacterized protein n=1 Tax=Exidia glandulosa HHB12029 TaxID=1314781 RepID=A0A166N932_EXIGL|nr:hypothetical protein EXIGLDRAFT_498086 [Exidia glandulosa HHB12029]
MPFEDAAAQSEVRTGSFSAPSSRVLTMCVTDLPPRPMHSTRVFSLSHARQSVSRVVQPSLRYYTKCSPRPVFTGQELNTVGFAWKKIWPISVKIALSTGGSARRFRDFNPYFTSLTLPLSIFPAPIPHVHPHFVPLPVLSRNPISASPYSSRSHFPSAFRELYISHPTNRTRFPPFRTPS